jgi:hypothetical protein
LDLTRASVRTARHVVPVASGVGVGGSPAVHAVPPPPVLPRSASAPCTHSPGKASPSPSLCLQGRVRFGDLDREAQKAITKLCKPVDAGPPCDSEMVMLLRCLKRVDFHMEPCAAEAAALRVCVDMSKGNKVRDWWVRRGAAGGARTRALCWGGQRGACQPLALPAVPPAASSRRALLAGIGTPRAHAARGDCSFCVCVVRRRACVRLQLAPGR